MSPKNIGLSAIVLFGLSFAGVTFVFLRAFTSGTQGTFTTQTALAASTTYYWRAAAIDPNAIATRRRKRGDVPRPSIAAPIAAARARGPARRPLGERLHQRIAIGMHSSEMLRSDRKRSAAKPIAASSS